MLKYVVVQSLAVLGILRNAILGSLASLEFKIQNSKFKHFYPMHLCMGTELQVYKSLSP
jgi:hypothetical protein